MKLNSIMSALLAAIITTGLVTTVQAQEKGKTEQAEKKKSGAYPFNGKVASVGADGKSITLQGKEKARVIQIAPDTRIIKDGKPAKLADATAGESVGGQVKKDDAGKEIAVSLRIGAAPEAKGGEKKKKDEKK